MRIPSRLLPHSIIVERYKGSGGYGDFFADPVSLDRVNVEDKVQLVRNPKGVEVTSSATIYLEIPDEPIEPGSYITRWSGTPYSVRSKVIAVQMFIHPRGLSHMVLSVE